MYTFGTDSAAQSRPYPTDYDMKKRILIIFSHPAYQRSIVNRALREAASDVESTTIQDLYERYYDFNINVKDEQQLLIDHDIIVFQFPLHWYSCPAILKQWMDLVLEHNFAYGKLGTALNDKKLQVVVTTGGGEATYESRGANNFPLQQFLLPIMQTTSFCGMQYLPPYAVHGAHRIKTAAQVHHAWLKSVY